jgi:hypothetical protein
VAGHNEHSNKSLYSLKCGEFAFFVRYGVLESKSLSVSYKDPLSSI